MEEIEEDDNDEDLQINIEKGDEFLDKLTGDSLLVPAKFKSNRYFTNFYFWLFYIFTISCFYDIYLYICYYSIDKEKIFSIITFYGRIVSDLFMVIPNFIFNRRTIIKNKHITIILCGLLCFLPQLAINILSLILFYFFEDKIMNISSNNSNEKKYLMISTIINTFLNLLCSFFSIIKVYFNY